MQLSFSDSSYKNVAIEALALVGARSQIAVMQFTTYPEWHQGFLHILKTSPLSGSLPACICIQAICKHREALNLSIYAVEVSWTCNFARACICNPECAVRQP